MPEYINPNPYVVQLVGPDGKTISLRSQQRKTLSEYFEVYVGRGYIKPYTNQKLVAQKIRPNVHARVQLNKMRRKVITQKVNSHPKKTENAPIATPQSKKQKRLIRKAQTIAAKANKDKQKHISEKRIVGRRIHVDGQELLKRNLATKSYPISNGIGVGILSYNRHHSLRRLVQSILSTTDLTRTTVFISDDGSNDPDTKAYIRELAQHKNFVVLCNNENIGIAGNSNRLIRCLSRFRYGLLMNDDVEILNEGWDHFYVDAFKRTGMHHFQHRQPGIYGATMGELVTRNGVQLRVVHDKPHGAVLAFTREMLIQCGYFNEAYGQYGMEHVDWSSKAFESQLQSAGFYDVEGSCEYFKLHPEHSAVQDRVTKLRQAKVVHEHRTFERVGPTQQSRVPEITYVVPFRNIGRQESIATVINNVRAQRFPVIHIVMVEQDKATSTDLTVFEPAHYYLAKETQHLLFNKSMAFNMGVANSLSDKVVLHDADMIVTGDYTAAIWDTLKTHEACHLGGTVVYATAEATGGINEHQLVTADTKLERVVGYFEGGSLACTTSAYWRVGGFNEDFYGYGCEDCEFYARLSRNTNWRDDRRFDFLHLWHSRVPNWNDHHNANRSLEQMLSSTNMTVRVEKQRQQLCRIGYKEFVEKT